MDSPSGPTLPTRRSAYEKTTGLAREGIRSFERFEVRSDADAREEIFQIIEEGHEQKWLTSAVKHVR